MEQINGALGHARRVGGEVGQGGGGGEGGGEVGQGEGEGRVGG